MSKATINIGTIPNDGTGDVMRTSFTKVNSNFDELYYTTSNLTSNLTILDNKLDTQIGDLYQIVETSFDVANAAYTFANNQYAAMNAAYTMANTVNSLFYGAAVNAAASFDFANSLTIKLNTNFTTTNSAYTTGNAAFVVANASYLTLNSAFDYANVTNQLAGQAFDLANVDFILVQSAIANAAYAFNRANNIYDYANGVSANTTSSYRVANSAYNIANVGFDTTNAVYFLTNTSFTRANAAYAHANTKVNTVNGIVTGTFSVQGSMSVTTSSSFAGYHTIDDSGSIFRTSSSGYGVRIYPPNGSGSGILQFTDVFQSTQWGSMYANNSEFGIGSSINAPVKVKVNNSTISTFSSLGMTITGQIWSTDNITAYYSSDITLKENIVLIDNAINKVKQIRGVSFDWTDSYIKSHGGEDDYFMRKHDVGVIAQEVEKILPEIVADRDDGTKAVRYEKIIPLLIEAIKELSEEVERLKNASPK